MAKLRMKIELTDAERDFITELLHKAYHYPEDFTFNYGMSNQQIELHAEKLLDIFRR